MITSNQFYFLVGGFTGEILMAGCTLVMLKEIIARFETVQKGIQKEIQNLRAFAHIKTDPTVYPIRVADMKPADSLGREIAAPAVPEKSKRTVTVRNGTGKLVDVYEVPEEHFSLYKLYPESKR